MDTIHQDMGPAGELTSLVEWAGTNPVVEFPRKCWVWEWEQASWEEQPLVWPELWPAIVYIINIRSSRGGCTCLDPALDLMKNITGIITRGMNVSTGVPSIHTVSGDSVNVMQALPDGTASVRQTGPVYLTSLLVPLHLIHSSPAAVLPLVPQWI